ncbi:hypothetical protein PTKIN_Ptkin13bG0102800 [Pterospermum kingtungense]
MDMWDKLPREDRCRNRRENPSFSSTLLDAIYRSIDESNGSSKGQEELIFYRETTMRKKQSNNTTSLKKGEEMTSLQRACMIEKWMEKKVSCHKSMADSERNSRNDFDPILLNSSSTSSDSSCGGGFSSSESDSFYSAKSTSSSSNHYTSHRPKPIRTSIVSSARPERSSERPHQHEVEKKPKHEGGFVRTKSKALKIYSDLKKVKQPISPGGRLASFLNSLFTAGNAKKAKISSSTGYEERKLKSEQATSTCSSASSFSRSCLSKTPSSTGKLSSNGTKRSVRFCPVSVILDEDSRPCGHKNILHENDHQTSSMRKVPIDKELEFRIMEENRRVMEAAKDLLKSYQKKKEAYDMRHICSNTDQESSGDEDDDAASYASSDLFELDNLSAIGIERYREELPVYETTHLDTNRAIANGLLV